MYGCGIVCGKGEGGGVGLHSVDSCGKCIGAVREHLVVSLRLAVCDLHAQDVTLF